AISTAAAVLETFLSAPKDTSQRHRRARVFLTAYVILTCPSAILQEATIAQRKLLRAAAKRLLVNFEGWVNAENAAGRPSLTKMRTFWTSYVNVFQNWLSNDKEQLLCGMIAHYQELQQIRDTLRRKAYDVAETDDACDEIECQLKQLEQKIISIDGTALERINQKVTAVASSPVASAPTPPISDDEDKYRPSNDSAQDNNERAQHMMNETAVPSVTALTNERLAHEIILDPDFKLQRQTPQESVERQVADIATRAYFDKLAQDLENGDANDAIPPLFAEIRDRLSNLVNPSTKSELNEGIDLVLIKQQLEQNVFDFDKIIEFILDAIQRSCASVRDNAVREIRYFTGGSNSSHNVTKLRLIFDLLQDMTLDLANHQLRSLRPRLLPIAVEYGRNKFAETIKEQGLTELPKTKAWLGEAATRLQETASQRNPEGIPCDSNLLSRQEVYVEAVTSLIMSSELINSSPCPETLRLDTGRLQEYQNEAQAITIVAALLMLARNFGVPQQCHGELAQKLFVLLAQPGTTIPPCKAMGWSMYENHWRSCAFDLQL
ncbi:T-complex protein 11-domain-containing protein, partial [Zychaea mexicana]|uniref:T-complex protein 11-domain-containing protein n=1 Tax=Zychaea mexicana TaxID=64656 RepID=UPI0022FE1D30